MLRIAAAVMLVAGLMAQGAKAQDAVEQAYRRALEVTPTPATLQREQQEWQAQWTQYSDERAELERYRLAELEMAAVRHETIRSARPSLSTLPRTCVDTGLSGCVVDRTGTLVMPEGATLHFQTQSGSSEEFGISEAVVILQPDGEALIPVMWLFGQLGVLDPAIHTGHGEDGEMRAEGTYVALPGYGQGTGSQWMGVLFRWNGTGRAPTEIDAQSWLSDLAERLPPGLSVWKGPGFEWGSLIAHSPLWQDTDGNCCSTGGEVVVDLKVEGDRLVLGNVSVTDAVLTVAQSVDPAVLEWLARQQQCQYWAGEEPYDAERAGQIEEATSRLRCAMVDSDEETLRTRFAGNESVLAMFERARGQASQ